MIANADIAVELSSSVRPRDGLFDGTSRYIPTLDGWRAVAIIGVILCHSSESLLQTNPQRQSSYLLTALTWGRLGVDLFFAISGFLITGRLLDETRRHGRFSLSRFYIRRSFRILPPYLFYLVVIGLLATLGLLQVSGNEIFDCLLFVRNYTIYQGSQYTSHFWSLAVEEHFYLLWPLLLLVVGPRRAIWMIPVLALTIAAWRTLDLRYQFFANRFLDPGVHFRTDTRLDSLLWGCLAALILPSLDCNRWGRSGGWLWAGIIGILVLWIVIGLPILSLGTAVLFPALVLSTVLFPQNWAGLLLDWSPLRWIGRTSYSLYLWQSLFLKKSTGNDLFLGFSWLQDFPWNFLAIIATASFSYFLIERPMIRLGHRFSAHRKTVSESPNRDVVASSLELKAACAPMDQPPWNGRGGP